MHTTNRQCQCHQLLISFQDELYKITYNYLNTLNIRVCIKDITDKCTKCTLMD